MKPANFLKFCLLWLLMTSFSTFAQGVQFEAGPWSDVLKKAAREKKLVLLHIDSKDCSQCVEVATVGFRSPLLREKYNLNFVSYRINPATPEGAEVAGRYSIANGPVSLYLAADGSLLHRFNASTTNAIQLSEQVEIALSRRNQPSLVQMEREFAAGNRKPQFLRTYLERRQSVELDTEEVLDVYVKSLPADSLRSAPTLLFILERAPVLGSRADSLVRRDWRRLDSLYRFGLRGRAAQINTGIINKSRAKAVRTRDARLAFQTANFARSTHTRDERRGQYVFEWNMLHFFRESGDTARYIRAAIPFYELNFMSVKVDSIARLDEQDRQNFLRSLSQSPGSRSAGYAPNPHGTRLSQSLNGAAWSFWEMATEPDALERGLVWSKRSLEFLSHPNPSLMDTYARLLYKLGRRPEAIEWQTRAVEINRQQGMPSETFSKALAAMKAGTLKPGQKN